MTLETNIGRPSELDPLRVDPPRRSPSWQQKRFLRTRLDVRTSPYIYVAPFFLLFGVFGLYPLAYTAWVSLHDWRLAAGDGQPFVGMENYTKLLADSDFWNAVVNTLGIFVIATVPQLLVALWIAALLNRKLRSRTLFRMSVLMPNVTSTAAVAIVFGQIFSKDFGMVNWLLKEVGLNPVNWQNSRIGAWMAVATMVDWRWTGYNALIFLAAMQAIPRNLYE
jgi:cellobiose transport system permease protein